MPQRTLIHRSLRQVLRACSASLRRVAVIGVLTAVLLAGCTLPSRTPPDVSEWFADARSHELAAAVLADDGEEIRALVTAGAPVGIQGNHGLTLLQWAILHNRHEALLALLDAGADPNQLGEAGDTAIHSAALSSDPRHLVALLDFGGDPNVQGEITGNTPLDHAIRSIAVEPVHILLEAGADPNISDHNADVPLHTAARTNKGWAILLLLEAGADPEVVNSRGTSWQDLYWDFAPEILNERSHAERREIITWLDHHGHELSPKAEPFRMEHD